MCALFLSHRVVAGGDYVLEKLSEAGKPVDLTTSLADQQTTDFILVRKDSK